MKVLVLAYACEPGRTSEPGVGWNVVGQLCKFADVTVVTRRMNEGTISQFIRENPESLQAKAKWLYYELPQAMYWLKKRIPEGIQIYQELWQRSVAKQHFDESESFDIVHHLTFGSIFFTPWGSSTRAKFVWGPVGGAVGALPLAFLRRESLADSLREYFYRFVGHRALVPSRRIQRKRDRASAILFRTEALRKLVPLRAHQVGGVIPETAYDKPIVERAFERAPHPLRILCVGRLVCLKGVVYSIRAFASFLQQGGFGTLLLLGDGPQRELLKAEVRRLGVESRVSFVGHVANDVVLQEMRASDLLLHLSFREGGSWSILEAMAQGMVTVCQHRAGMIDMVADSCGSRVVATTPEELVASAATELLKYYRNSALLEVTGRNAQARVRDVYTWDRIGTQFQSVYREVLKA